MKEVTTMAWMIVSVTREGHEKRLIANGYCARIIVEVIAQHHLPVRTWRVETYRDAETMNLFVLDEKGQRWWVVNEQDLLMKGYSEVSQKCPEPPLMSAMSPQNFTN
jgi:N-acetyl-gamma-glutamylphosphate reductase